MFTKLRMVLLSSALISATVYGQHAPFEVGINGGIGTSKVLGVQEQVGSDDFELAWLAGASFQWNVNENISLFCGINYEYRESDFMFEYFRSGLPFSQVYPYQASFEFLSIPILLKYHLGQKRIFFVSAGPQIDLLMKRTDEMDLRWKEDYLPPETTPDEIVTFDATNLQNTVNMGAAVGLGFSKNISPRLLFEAELRTSINFTKTEYFVAALELPAGNQMQVYLAFGVRYLL
jgi:hypothetical protein